MTLLTLENTGFVIDSTCDPTDHFRDMPNVAMVPLKVLFGDEAFDDGIEMTIDQFFEKLASSPVMPTSSQPTAAQFAACYEKMCAQYEHVFSIHITEGMSGTVTAARAAAEAFPAVEVHDSMTVSAGCALLVDRLHSKVQEGMALDDLHAYIDRFRRSGRLFIHAASLDHLRRGGRLGRTQTLVGGVLGIHPLVHVVDGVIAAFGQARGARRAFDAMMQYIQDNAPSTEKLYVGLLHGGYPEAIDIMRERVLALRPDAQIVFSGSIGCVVGVHIGPGPSALAFVTE